MYANQFEWVFQRYDGYTIAQANYGGLTENISFERNTHIIP